jgi:hypothetical protein
LYFIVVQYARGGFADIFLLRVGQGGVSEATLCVGNTTLPKWKATIETEN